MPSITTRLSVRTRNLFANAFSARHDKVTSVTAEADRRVRNVKNASGSPLTLIDASDYHDAGTETVFLFIKNNTTVANKFLYVKVGAQVVAKLKPGSYIMWPWYVASESIDVSVYSNDATNGVKCEYFAAKETT